MPTDSATMIPIRALKSRLFQPLATGLKLEEEPSPPLLPAVAEVEEAGDVVEAPPVAIGPTLMVVVDAGWPELVGSQLSITAAMPPL